MIDGILDSIKKPLGIDAEYDVFDEDILMHINSVFSTLHSIGASPAEPFIIFSKDETWNDYLLDVKQAMMVKTYMYLKVRLLFDPPTTSFALDAFKRQADEFEWRLGIMEFVFNPLSRPIQTDEESKILARLNRKIDQMQDEVDKLDEEVDSVPDLSIIYTSNLGE